MDIKGSNHDTFSLGYIITSPVLDDMLQRGEITEKEYDEIVAQNIETAARVEEYSNEET